LAGDVFVCRTNVKPVELLDGLEVSLVELGTLGQLLRAAVGNFADQKFFNTVKGVGFNNAQLIVQIQAEALEFIVNNLLRTLVAHDAFTCEHLNVDHGTLRALIHAQ